MPRKLSTPGAHPAVPGQEVPKQFIGDLILKFRGFSKKRKRTDTSTTRAHDIGNDDSKSCWFPYSELEALFKDNGLPPTATPAEKAKYGIRIYFGMHDKDHSFHQGATGVKLPNKYDEQHTVILVATLQDTSTPAKNVDLLIEGTSSVSFTGDYKGDGMDIGSLCPPACDGGQTWS